MVILEIGRKLPEVATAVGKPRASKRIELSDIGTNPNFIDSM